MYKVLFGPSLLLALLSVVQHSPAIAYDKAEADYDQQERPQNYYQDQLKSYTNDLNDLSSPVEDLQQLDEYSPPNYEFQYQVHGGGNSLGHSESRVNSQTTGTYFVDLPNGMRQVVSYVADESGFRPKITYEPIEGNLIDDVGRPNEAFAVAAEQLQARKVAYEEPAIEELQQPLRNYGPQPRVRIVRRRRQRKPLGPGPGVGAATTASPSHGSFIYKRFPEFGQKIY